MPLAQRQSTRVCECRTATSLTTWTAGNLIPYLLNWSWRETGGRGTIALDGARIITLDDRRVIEEGTILVRDGRITCVG